MSYPAIQPGLPTDELLKLLADGFAGERDAADRWALTVRVARENLRACVIFLRDDPRTRFDQLLDVTGIDYLSFPNWSGPRFAVSYPMKSTLLNHQEFIGHPLRKDYPCQKRQKLSVNDPMFDQLEAKLVKLGYELLDHPADQPQEATP